MKSLEIVNERIRRFERGIKDIQTNGEYIEGLLIIKLELEVLEILREKKVNIDYLYCLYTWYRDYNYDKPIISALEKYNDKLEFNRQITQEELNKIMHYWQEEENETK